MPRHQTNVVFCFVCCFWSVAALCEYFEKSTSLGEHALSYDRKSHYWIGTGFEGIDGAIETSPPEAVSFDRRANLGMNFGGEMAFQSGNGLRFHLDSSFGMRRQEEQEPPKSPITSSYIILKPAMDFTYINPKGLELVAGIEQIFIPAYKEELESDLISSETKYASTTVHAFRAAIVKRGAQWSGGFYYRQGRENTGDFEKTASSGSSIEGQRIVHLPTTFGITSEVQLKSFQFQFDLATIQESEGGERTATGQTVLDDFLRIRLDTTKQFTGYALTLALAHRTLSYSAGAFTTLDTIPNSDFGLHLTLGTSPEGHKIGLTYGTGDDGQSIPEFNAHYKRRSLTLSYEVFQGW